MNFDQIEAFIYAAHTESFSQTGEILFISQPSVSLKIKTLEQEMGVTLFERTGKKVRLSNEGRLFLPHAQNVMKSLQQGVSSIEKSKNSFDRQLNIASVFSGVSYVLPRLLNKFRVQHPSIKPVVFTGHSDQVLKMVLDNEVSVGIVRSLLHAQIESFPLIKDEMILAFHPEHPFVSKSDISIEDVAAAAFILFKHETIDWTLIHNAFERARLSPNITLEVDSIDGAKQMVKENLGISILPHFSVAEELGLGQLKTASVTGMPVIRRNFDLIYTRHESLNRAAAVFIDFLKEDMGGY